MKTRNLNYCNGFLLTILSCQCVFLLVANASVSDFQTAVQSESELMHQYTFDGDSNEERLADKAGAAHLAPRPYGSGVATDIVYGEAGFDETSEAVATARGPGSDLAHGTGLHNTSVNFGDAFSFETIFQPRASEISGGIWNLGYIITTRVDNDRGYFLVQGNAPLPSTGQQLSSTIGDGFAERNQNLILDNVEIDHWYYVAGSYAINRDNNTTVFTNYIADLTAGDTVLTKIGPFSNSGGPYPTGSSPLGIGGRWDAGESFPGLIDEINLYNTENDQSKFQEHLDLLTGGQIPFEITEITREDNASSVTIGWNSVPGKTYAVDVSINMIDWDELDDGVAGEKGTTTFTDTEVPEDSKQRFYRVREIEL